jgi:uncharacterized membrane protein YbhN (UPF0104 family)
MQRHLAQIAVLAATATFALLFLRTVSWDETRAQLGAIPPTTVLAAVGAVLASLGLTALRWRYLLRAAGVEARVPRLFAGLVAGGAVNNLVPARGGDLVRVRSVPARTSAVVGTLAAERLLDGFVLSLFIVGGVAVTGAAQPLLVAGIGLAVATALAMALASLQPPGSTACRDGCAALSAASPSSARRACSHGPSAPRSRSGSPMSSCIWSSPVPSACT